MKKLVLLRHFKSSWDEAGMSDHNRPLAPRGQRDAAAMAATMVSRDLAPERVLCSPARRTRETLAALQEGIAGMDDVVFVDELYDGPEVDYRAIIAVMGGEADRLMVIGHNPRIHATALALIGSGSKTTRAQLAHKYPTGALTVIDFDADNWPAAAEGDGRLAAFIRPHDVEHSH